MSDDLQDWVRRAARFQQAAHKMLAAFDSSVTSRVIALSDTRKQLSILSLQQSDLLEEALRAMEAALYRPAIVMAWAAFMDFLQQKLASDGLAKLHANRPAWAKYKTLDELREGVTEYQMIEVSRDLRLLNKAEMKALHGLLSKRNECAHPSGYRPGLNEALGYVSELLNRIPTIGQRSL